MNFLVCDESGFVTQSNKLWSYMKGDGGRKQNHRDLLHDMGQRFAEMQSAEPLDPARWYVDSRRVGRQRPVMQATLNKTQIKAGENDAAIINGIIRDTKLIVRTRMFQQEPIHEQMITDGKAEISFPTPGLYVIELVKFPFQDWKAEVEVVS